MYTNYLPSRFWRWKFSLVWNMFHLSLSSIVFGKKVCCNLSRGEPTQQGGQWIPVFHLWSQSLRLQSIQWRILRAPFKEDIRRCGLKISFCGVGDHRNNEKMECRIKEPTLGRRTLLLHATILCKESVRTMLWPFPFKVVRYKTV